MQYTRGTALKSKALLALKRYARRREIREKQIGLMEDLRRVLLMKQHMRLWHGTIKEKFWCERMTDTGVLAFAHWLKKQCFKELFSHCQEEQIIRKANVVKNKRVKSSAMHQLKKHAYVEKLGRSYKQFIDKKEKKAIFEVWFKATKAGDHHNFYLIENIKPQVF